MCVEPPAFAYDERAAFPYLSVRARAASARMTNYGRYGRVGTQCLDVVVANRDRGEGVGVVLCEVGTSHRCVLLFFWTSRIGLVCMGGRSLMREP